MKISKSILAIIASGAVLTSACTTLDPYTREERTARAQRQAVIGAVSVPLPDWSPVTVQWNARNARWLVPVLAHLPVLPLATIWTARKRSCARSSSEPVSA